MQCFETRKELVDLPDGVPHAHLDSCTRCQGERERIKTLLSVLKQQPRAKLSTELREDPLGATLPKLIRNTSPKKLWQSMPVTARLILEGITIAGVVMLGIHLGPRLRALYEEQMDLRLQNMIAAEDADTENIPLERTGGEGGETTSIADSEYESDETETPITVAPGEEIQVGRSEIWRFNLKTDSPTLVRSQIIKSLRDAKISDQTPGFGGLEAPGGIQFDLLVPTSVIPELKVALERLAGPKAENLPFSETFTWYKNRSKKPIPNGQARIVIWLSQI